MQDTRGLLESVLFIVGPPLSGRLFALLSLSFHPHKMVLIMSATQQSLFEPDFAPLFAWEGFGVVF